MSCWELGRSQRSNPRHNDFLWRIKDKYSIASFSLQDQDNLKQTGDDNLEHHQQGDIVLMYKRILKTNFKRNVWESVGRVNV